MSTNPRRYRRHIPPSDLPTSIKGLLRYGKILTRTGKGIACACIGGVLGFIAGSYWVSAVKQGFALGTTITIPLGSLLGLCLYTLFAEPTQLFDCLAVAQALFIEDKITEVEYSKLRAKCLKKSKAI